MAMFGLLGGVPLGLSIAAVAVGFNYKLADWASNLKDARASKDAALTRAAELRRHAYLLGLGSLGLASTVIARKSPFLPFRYLATGSTAPELRAALGPIGLSWGGGLTVVGAVMDEWDHYNEGARVLITGATLVGLLAVAMV
jgi:hypothetical protein